MYNMKRYKLCTVIFNKFGSEKQEKGRISLYRENYQGDPATLSVFLSTYLSICLFIKRSFMNFVFLGKGSSTLALLTSWTW